MDLLKKYWYLAAIALLVGVVIFQYTHPQQAAPTASRQQVRQQQDQVKQAQADAERDKRAAAWAAAQGADAYHAGTTAAQHATTIRSQTHAHALPRPRAATTDSAVRAADLFLSNY